MSKRLDPVLPAPVARLLDTARPDAGVTLGLLTVDRDGWPRQALISVGEVVALDGTHLRLAAWPASTTTGNLTASGRAVLTAVADGAAYSVALALSVRGPLAPSTGTGSSAGPPTAFDARVTEVRADVVPYAVLETGTRFRLVDPESTAARWHAVRGALRALPPG